jgi:hypothetical protein
MPGKRGTERRKLDGGQVLVRLTSALAAAVAAQADAAGLTEAAWIRSLVAAAVDAEPAGAVPVRAYEQPHAPQPEHVLELARLREAVGEATGAITKSAVFAKVSCQAETHALLEALLPLYRQHALDLDRLKLVLMAPRQAPGRAG